MKFGCISDLSSCQNDLDSGCDYVEFSLKVLDPESPKDEFEPVKEEFDEIEVRVECWDKAFPKDMKVVGEEADIYRIERYLRTAFERIEELGGDMVVFDAAGARTVPEGFSREEAREQIIELLTLMGQIAGIHGITVAVQPLPDSATNIINSIEESLDIVRAVDHPFVRSGAYVGMPGECGKIESILKSLDEVVYIRVIDASNSDLEQASALNELMNGLKEKNYEEKISVNDIEDIALLKNMIN